MKRYALPMAAAFFALALSGPTASAQEAQETQQQSQQGTQQQTQQQAQLSIEDRHFVMHAVPANLAEIEISRLATEKAQNDQVRQYAERMIQDHTQANEQLMQIAQQKGLEPPQEISPAHRAEMEHLQQLSGTEFDRQYIGGQIIDHAMAINLYQRESQQGQDQELTNFASQTLPTLQEHHDMALEISGQALTAEQ